MCDRDDIKILKMCDIMRLKILKTCKMCSWYEFLCNSQIECCPYCGSVHIVKAGKTVKEHNAINATIVNEGSLIVQII